MAKSTSNISGRDKALLVVAVVILLAAGGIFAWQQSTRLKPGDVIIHDDATAAAAPDADGEAGDEIEVETLQGLAPDQRPKGGSVVIEGN